MKHFSPKPPSWVLFLFLLWLPVLAFAQGKYVPSRITQPVDETALTVLKGNTHRLARAEFDRGAAPPSLPMERMLLVLKRSPEQEAALSKLLDAQQDQSSPSYHKWLTPEQFGLQFGPSDQDLQVVTAWLRSHGFEVAKVATGRTVIEFSGTASQVQAAFHTQIHKYALRGEEHWANASDPQIPSALAAVVAGVHTLHNFVKKPMLHVSEHKIAAKLVPGPLGTLPHVTFPQGGGLPDQHFLGPGDFAVIYNLNPLYTASPSINGTGITIGIVGRSNINPSDIQDFQSVFFSPGSVNPPQVVLDGPDPGDLGGGEEVEALLDTTWSSAIAPNANVQFVVSATTNTTDGVDLSELYIVDNNLANVMTESFGTCELFLTSAQLSGVESVAEQAAAQGITFIASAGDSGSSGCDNPNSETVATQPLAVSVPASTRFTVAAGGTLFSDTVAATYWSSSSSALVTALSYIPENAWNESCTVAQCGATNANIFAGGGGKSSFFPKPSWQSPSLPNLKIPNDGVRDVPDVSLTSALHDGYLLCDLGSCVPDSQGFISFFVVGGTSAAAPTFAGIMALVDQKMAAMNPGIGSRQGQANYVLYKLASNETLSQCNASNAPPLPAKTCIFNDVTVGNNSVPGGTGYGTATAPYQTAVGYDLATGLGSVNAANLVNNWSTVAFRPTTTTLSLNSGTPVNVAHGTAVNVAITVAPSSGSGTPSGDVSLLTSPTGVNNSSQTVGLFNLAGGAVSSTTNLLPGGTYTVSAHYAGDGTFAASDSAATSVTMSAEPSTTTLSALTADASGNAVPFTAGPYGSFVYLRADVASQSGHGVPTGQITFSDTGGFTFGSAYNLNSAGNTATPNGVFTFAAGPHAITASYGGDASFNASASSPPVGFSIAQAATSTAVASSSGSVGSGSSVTLTATVSTNSGGNAPTGTLTFFSGSSQLGTASAVGGVNTKTGAAQATATFATTALPVGTDSVTAQYGGDTNYTASTSPPITVAVQADFTLAASASSLSISSPGGSGTLTLNVTGQTGYNGTIAFTSASCSGIPAESSCSFNPASLTGSGKTVLTLSTTGPHAQLLIPGAGPKHLWWSTIGGASLACVVLIGFPAQRRRRNKLLALLAFSFLITFAGCGGGSSSTKDPGTPTGTYPVTVTATSGSLSHTVKFTLTVQ